MLSDMKVLFLRTGNSCRSQMAEGWARHQLAEGAATEEEALSHDRRVRDEIRAFVETLSDALADGEEDA